MSRKHRWAIALGTAGVMLASLVTVTSAASAEPAIYQDAARPTLDRVSDLMARMSLEDKLGQMLQTERKAVQPGDLTTHRIGSLLSGGGSAPSPNTATSWADMYDNFQRAALATPLRIPMIYGIDAVHGHDNVHGATIFPHNIGLGATRDANLVQRIGRATAEEVAGTGIDWDFPPCLCVARNDRWGRTYESYGEETELATSMTTLITGLQGSALDAPGSVLATAKHWVGDGATTNGTDQGNAQIPEAELRSRHIAPFREAIRRNVGSVMVSYSSVNGVKMHAHKYLVDDVLKNELGFSGIVISDWDAIDKIDGQASFTPEEVRLSVNAGIDIIMVSSEWRKFLDLLRTEVRSGRVSMARIDDANRRILTKKFELGLFEKPFTDRSFTSTVGSAAHRALAREAVRKSQVLLKNANGVLPLPKTADKLFVAGKNASDIGNQSGGWTIDWQGRSGAITPGTTILQGIQQAVQGSTVTYNRNGDGINDTYKAAIAVVGETPYAEFNGDRPGGLGLDAEDLATLAKLKAAGVPVVVVLVSGRPMDIAAQLGNWDALVAAWLPGTEGVGVADVLFGDHAVSGTLPMSWMRSVSQQPINNGDGQSPLFGYGFGEKLPTAQDAYKLIGAAYYDEQRGTQIQKCTDSGCGQNVGWLSNGDHLGYADVDFGTAPATRVTTRFASGTTAPGSVAYRLDSPTGPLVATQAITATGGWQNWSSATATVTGATGKHRLYVVPRGGTGDFVNLNWFQFAR